MSVCLAAFGVLRLQDWDGAVEVVVDDDLGPTLVSAQGAADGLRDQPRERDLDAELRWLEPGEVSEVRFPLWGPDPAGVMALSPAAARATGHSPRSFAETIRYAAAWMESAEWRRDGVGVHPDDESRLLGASRDV